MSALMHELAEARDLFFKQHDAPSAERALTVLLRQASEPGDKRATYELMGLILRDQKRFEEAGRLYDQIEDFYQAGYCALLQGNLHKVQEHWTKTVMQRHNHWCVSLYGLATRQLRSYPTLFQIRNHLESDIANLIASNQIQFLENMLGYVDFLTQLNLETPKFVGRSLMHCNWLDHAGPFLIKAQKALPNDPEIYFHLGQYGIAQKRYKEARLMLNQCCLISPSYTPAVELLKQIPEVPTL